MNENSIKIACHYKEGYHNLIAYHLERTTKFNLSSGIIFIFINSLTIYRA